MVKHSKAYQLDTLVKMIPDRCPVCQEQAQWKEIVNPFLTGIPIGKHVRIRIGLIKGFRIYKVIVRCGKCGYENTYDYREDH